MRAIPDAIGRARALLRRVPWRPVLVTVAMMGIPTWFAVEAYRLATIVYVASEGKNVHLGPAYDYGQRRGQLIEAVAYATSDPSARFEATGARRSSEWRLVSRGRIAFSGQDSLLSGKVPDMAWSVDYPNMYWRGERPSGWYSLGTTSLARVAEGLVVETSGEDCRKTLQWASTYALQRMRGAWGRRDASYELDLGGPWSAPGEARRLCDEGGGAGKAAKYDRFLMLFEVARDGSTASVR